MVTTEVVKARTTCRKGQVVLLLVPRFVRKQRIRKVVIMNRHTKNMNRHTKKLMRLKLDFERDNEFNIDCANWLKDLIYDDTHSFGAEYFPFCINDITTIRSGAARSLPETQTRVALTVACEEASWKLNGRARRNAKRHPIGRSVGCVYLPATEENTTDAFIGNHLHGWVRSPMPSSKGLGTQFVSTQERIGRVVRPRQVRVPSPVAWFVESARTYLGTENVWLPVRKAANGENVSTTEMSMGWGNLDYLLGAWKSERRHWDCLSFAPSYLFPKIVKKCEGDKKKFETSLSLLLEAAS